MIQVFDDVLPDPMAYRAEALTQTFANVETGPGVVFQGIAPNVPSTLPDWLFAKFTGIKPTLSFFRKSPKGQEEPNLIHTDRDMGDWTAILYLNPETPAGDGTDFYQRILTGERESLSASDDAFHQEWLEWRKPEMWAKWHHVEAKFNRLLVFTSSLYHARAIPENYGEGDNARLLQLVFGTGDLQPAKG